MKTFHYHDAPLKVFGVPFFDETGILERLPMSVREKMPSLEFLGRRCPGARLSFRTNSPTITLKAEYETLTVDIGMAIYACQSFNVLIGERKDAYFAGLAGPSNYEEKAFEKTFKKSNIMEDVTIFFPRNEIIKDIVIEIEDEAIIEAPTPYKYAKPIVYYGSSITEGGCCTRVTNAYNALISNRLDVDYINFGFSGSARGELALADYFNTIDMSIFVMDYDHNAVSAQILRDTHKPFFERIREKNPTLPIVIMSRPDFDYDIDSGERREVIKETYLAAKNNGDGNVYFIDGETFFGNEERHLCTVDAIHPNDLGFYRMAEVIQPVIQSILKNDQN